MPSSFTRTFFSISLAFWFFSIPTFFGVFSDSPPPLAGGGGQVEISVALSTDDFEEKADGSVDLTSTDLEIVQESSTQKVGLRFQSVAIPKGAKIVAAYIKFKANGADSGATDLTISAEDVASASTFSATDKISTRTKTAASVSWTPTEAWVIGSFYKTSNFAPVVQEIVDRGDWNSGQNIAIFIEGTGKRVADSYDKAGGVPGKLVVVYDDTTPTLTKTGTFTQTDYSTELLSYNPDPTCVDGDWGSDWTKFTCPDGFKIDEYSDGSRILYGTMVNQTDNNNRWDIYLRLKDPKTWAEWDALGRMYYESPGGGNCNTDYTDWLYSEIDSTVSRIIGTQGYANEGLYSKIKHSPTDISKGVQTGFGANNCGGDCSCETNDIRGWCIFDGDFDRNCVDFGLNITGVEVGSPCSIFNGDFEDGLDYWSKGSSGSIAVTNDAHSGTKAVELSGFNSSLTYYFVAAEPGNAYLLSGYGKASGSVGWTAIQLQFFDANRNQIYAQGMQLSGTSWQFLNGGAVAPAGTYFYGIQIYKGGGGTAIFDDICLISIPKPGTGACAGITNNGFESAISTEWSPWGTVTQTTDAAEGTYAALIGGGVNGGISTSTAATQGLVYSLDFYTKQSGSINWAGAGLEFYDASWNLLSSSSTDNFSSTYEPKNITATAPPGTANVSFWVTKDGTGNLYIDRVCLEGTSVTEICDDGIDNDGDQLVDCDDPDCTDDGNCSVACIGNNLGFENDFTDWQAINGVTISNDAAVGSKSAYMNANDEKVRQNFNVQPDSLYQISFWAKGNVIGSDWAGAAMRFYDASDTYIGQLDMKTGGYSSWNQFFKLVKAPANSSYVQLELAVYGGSSDMYFDDICFQKSNYALPLSNESGCEIYPETEGKTSFWFKNNSGWITHNVMKGSVLVDNGNGTKTVRATVMNGRYETAYPCGQLDGWEVEVILSDKQDWATWGGNYDDYGIINQGCTDYHTDWDYWEISGGTITGLGCNAGQIHNVIGNGSGTRIQVGEGANRNGCNFGLAGRVEYNDNGTTQTFDLYFDIDRACYTSQAPTTCPNLLSNGEFDNGTAGWNVYLQSGSSAIQTIDNSNQLSDANSNFINISTASGTAWHIQLVQNGLTLEVGKTYTVSFEAKAAANRNIQVDLQQAVSPWSGYWGEVVALTTAAQTFSFEYTSTVDNFGDVALYFNLAATSDNVWIDNVNFSEKCGNVEICGNGLDYDGDGIGDDCDLDDDNDGILDVIECPVTAAPTTSGFLTSGDISFDISTNTVSTDPNGEHTLNSITLTSKTYPYSDFVTPDLFTTSLAVPSNSGTIHNQFGSTISYLGRDYNLNSSTFEADILPVFQDRNLNSFMEVDAGAAGNHYLLGYTNPIKVTNGLYVFVVERGGNNDQSIIARDANGDLGTVFISEGTYLDLEYKAGGNTTQNLHTAVFPLTDLAPLGSFLTELQVNYETNSSDGPDGKIFIFGEENYTDCVDTDGDGIPDYQDLDSDGDGCPDAIEGDASFTNGDLVATTMPGGNTGSGYIGTWSNPVMANLGNVVDADGIPDLSGVPQGIGDSQNGAVQSAECFVGEICGNNIDDDGDGLIDSDDPDCGSNCTLSNPYPGFPIDFLDNNTGWVDYDLGSDLVLVNNGDGTMTISGRIANGTPVDFGSGMNGTSCGATDAWTLDLTLSDKKNWTEWQAMGGSANVNGSCSGTSLDYWDISGTLTGIGCNAGRTLAITGPKAPYRLQIGYGGNNGDNTCAFGMSTWFDGNEGGTTFNSDIYAFLDQSCYEQAQKVAIGNYVFLDNDLDGSFTSGDLGISNVKVQLFHGDSTFLSTPIAEEITDGSGYYYFDELEEGDYKLYIPDGQFEVGNSLYNLQSANGYGADDDVDGDDNGRYIGAATGRGVGTHVINLTAGSEPISESGQGVGSYAGNLPDASVNETVDFGFMSSVAIGNLVYNDVNCNGVYDAGDTGIQNLEMRLYKEGASLPKPEMLVTTDADGIYAFDNVAPGRYFIGILPTSFDAGQPLEGLVSVQGGSDDEFIDDNIDSNGRLDGSFFNMITSGIIDVKPGEEPTNETGIATYYGTLPDENVNLTFDFAFADSTANCVDEICGNGIDDDGDGYADCADTDCGNMTITDITVSNCIDQPLLDVATVDITLEWTVEPENDLIQVTLDGKNSYIDVPGGATSPYVISLMVEANGATNIPVTASWKNTTEGCSDAATFDAPAACSADRIQCDILYLCGTNKFEDAEPWDHGMVEYLKAMNGSNTLTPALTKADLSGVGLYSVYNSSNALPINFSDYNLIVVSPSVGDQIASDLIDTLKQFPGGVLNMERRIAPDLGMASSVSWAHSSVAYTDASNYFTIYNYGNPNALSNEAVATHNYNAGGDIFLWRSSYSASSGQAGIMFYFDESDGLPGIPTHGDRVQLGYHMDGFYINETNRVHGGAPTTPDKWFDPVKHLTLPGKMYLDSAIVLAAKSCSSGTEICGDGLDNDGDSYIDCADPDCKGIINVTTTVPGTSCVDGGGQVDLTATGTAPFTYIWSDMAPDAQWTFEDDLTDVSGNGNDNNGGAVSNISYSSDAVEGQKSLQFDGNDYVRYSVNGQFMEVAFSTLTFSTWIKPSNLSGVKYIFDEGGGTNGIALRLNGATLEAAVRNGGSQTNAGALTFPSDGEWHHVAMVFDNGSFRIYIDGVGGIASTASFSTVNGHSGNGGIGYLDGGGGFGSGSGSYYSGLMDDARLSHSTALTANQIIDLARNDGDRFHLADGDYSVTVTNAASCVDSDTDDVTINNSSNVITGGTVSADQTICSGETPAPFSSITDASGGDGLAIVYEWESSLDDINWTLIGGATSKTYSSDPLTQTTYFRRGGSRTNCPSKIYSNTLIVTVVENFATPGAISGEEERCGSYDPTEVSSVSSPSGGLGGVVDYQWQISTDGTNWSDISSGIAPTFDPPTITQTTYYKRGVHREPCSGWVYSNVVVKTVVTNYTNGGIVSDDEIKCGSYDPEPITSTAAPSGGSGDTPEYIWEQNVNGGGWTVISGANSDSYDPALITETTQYRRGARRGPCTVLIYSNTVTKEVVSSPIANIDIYPTSTSGSLCENAEYTFAAEFAGASATYTWDFGAYATPSTATGQGPHVVLFDVPNGNNSTGFDVTLTTDLGGCQKEDVKSFSARPPLTITDIKTNDPSDCNGSDGSIEVTVNTPSGANYQVSINGGLDWGVINQAIFNNQTAGTYNIQVRYENSDCVVDYGVVVLNDPFLPESGILANYTTECSNQTFTYSALFNFFIGQYDWSFGAGATPATATGIGPHDVTYSTPGSKIVTLTISGFGCSKDYNDVFDVIDNYTDAGSITGDQNLCGSFDPASLTSNGAPTGGIGGTGEYQWEYRIADGIGGWDEWIEISGATSDFYDPSTISEPTQYRRKTRRNPCDNWLPTSEVTITPAGQPTANPISFTTVCPGQPHGDNLSSNDINLVNPVFSIYSQPSNGTLSVFSDGQFLYDPNTTFCGKDEFVYEVCNYGGTCCDTARVTLNLTDDLAPTLTNIPADVTIHCDENVPLPPIVNADENCLSVSLATDEISTQGIDNCALYDYEITRIWTATDYCGNGYSESQVITVEDKNAPNIYRIYTLPNGKKMIAGVMKNVSTLSKRIAFPITFPTTPMIFTQISTQNDPEAAVVQLSNISTSQFEMNLSEEEAGDQVHIREDVSWIAIEPGVQVTDSEFEVVAMTLSDISKTINFSNDFGAKVGFIASAQSSLEKDPFVVRHSGLTGTSVSVRLQEDVSVDSETMHVSENFAYMAFDRPGDFMSNSGEVIGETGYLSVSDVYTTVSLSHTYKNPVIIANTPSSFDGEPAMVIINDVTSTEFKVKLSEWAYQDGSHGAENVSYIVVEGSIPLDITASCDAIPEAIGLNTEIIAVDNCDLAVTLEFTEAPNDNNCAPGNQLTRTWSATDECGNTSMFSRVISVIDTVPPTFTRPIDVNISCLEDIDDLTITGDVVNEADNCTASLNATYTDYYPGGTDCDLGFTVERRWILSDGCGNTALQVQNIYVKNFGLRLSLRMMLQGAMYDQFGIVDSLMRDDLRAKGLLPLEEPYSNSPKFVHRGLGGGEKVDSSVFTVTGRDAIVDWVFVEIRHDTVPDSVLSTRSVLIQRDGDVVDVDGFSPVAFNDLSPGEYYVAMRHRNHLGVMTGTPRLLNNDPIVSTSDFTVNADSVLLNSPPRYVCSDFDGDGKVFVCNNGTTEEVPESILSTQNYNDAACGPCGDFETIADGDWMSGATWKGGTPPSSTVSGQTILIRHNVTIAESVTLQEAGMIWVENASLDITAGDVTVKDAQFLVRGAAVSIAGNLVVTNSTGKIEAVGCNINANQVLVTTGTAYFESTCLDSENNIEFEDATGHFVDSRVDITSGDFITRSVVGEAEIVNSNSKFHLMNGDFISGGSFTGEVGAIWLENGELINAGSNSDWDILACEDYDGDGQILVCQSGTTTAWVSTIGADDVCGPCGDFITISDGDWNAGSTWAGGTPPNSTMYGIDVIVNHSVTTTTGLTINQGANLWVENGSLDVTGMLSINDGNVVVRGANITTSADIELNQSSSRLEVVNGEVDVTGHFDIEGGKFYFESSKVTVRENHFKITTTGNKFVNSCVNLTDKAFEVKIGGGIISENSSFEINSDIFNNEGTVSGTISGLWIKSGNLQNSGTWTATIYNHCISGSDNIGTGYFSDSENCSLISSVIGNCGSASNTITGSGDTGGSGHTDNDNATSFPCEDFDGDGKIIICHSGTTALEVGVNAWAAHESHGDYCGPCGDYITIADGNWNNSATWENGNVPDITVSKDEIIINHDVILTHALKVEKDGIIWVENGSLHVTEKVAIEDGSVIVRGSKFSSNKNIELKNSKSVLEMINSELETPEHIHADDGVFYFENCKITAGEHFRIESSGNQIINSCLAIENGNFELKGGELHTENSSFRLDKGDFKYDGAITGTMSGLWLKDGDVVAGGSSYYSAGATDWIATVDVYCVSGSIGIAPGYLPNTESCVEIASITSACQGVSGTYHNSDDDYEEVSLECLDYDGDGTIWVCQDSLYTIGGNVSANSYCGVCGDFKSVQDGNWGDPSTWKGGIVPDFTLNDKDVVIQHHVISDENISLINGSHLWIENGTLETTSDKSIIVGVGYLSLRAGTIITGGDFETISTNSNLEIVKSILSIGADFNIPTSGGGQFYIQDSQIQIESDWSIYAGNIRVVNSCINIANGNFNNGRIPNTPGGLFKSTNASFNILNGNFVNSTKMEGQISGLNISNGNLENTGDWSASIEEHCVSGNIAPTVSPYLLTLENCAGIASITRGCQNVGDGSNIAPVDPDTGNDPPVVALDTLNNWLATVADYCATSVVGIDSIYLPSTQDCSGIASKIDACDCTTIVDDSQEIFIDSSESITAVAPWGDHALYSTDYGFANWGADLNQDGQSIFQGPNSDAVSILLQIISDNDNVENLPNYIRRAYNPADYDMDGQVIYQGPNNDRSKMLLDVILNHPNNFGSLANFIISQQIPK